MALNDLPTSLQAAIQSGFLERRFQKALRAKLGFRMIADREDFTAGVGETITKTRTGLLPANVTPMAPASLTDFTSGLSAQNYGLEQYVLGVAQYAVPMYLNIVTSKVAIDDVFLNNAYTLGENAARSVDTLAQKSLYDAYMGGNTRVTTTLGSAGTAVHVDDVRGFFQTLNTAGQPVAVSSSFPVSVVVGSDTYSLIGVTADGTAPTTINPWLANLAFSGSSSNTSTTPGGYSGTLTFSGNVTVADATALNAVQSAVAPMILRPSNSSTNIVAPTTAAISATTDVNSAQLTMEMILEAKAVLSGNGVPPAEAIGSYMLFADPIQLSGLFQDQAFQRLFTGKPDTADYKRGVVSDFLGVKIMETNLNPVQALSGVGNVRRAILTGQGALVEGVFSRTGYADANKVDDDMIAIIDDIAHITREPLDTLKQVVTQSWSYIGGFVAPTDVTTTSATVPTASSAAYKRAMILESL